MGRRLAAAVHLMHPTTREQLILQPGDEPDETLAELITNPAAWEPDDGDGQDDGGDGGQGEPPAGGTRPDPSPEPEPVVKPRTRARKQTDEK